MSHDYKIIKNPKILTWLHKTNTIQTTNSLHLNTKSNIICRIMRCRRKNETNKLYTSLDTSK